MKHTIVQTPKGAKDILPKEAYFKSRLEQRAAAYLEEWGYARVYTPTFEFLDAIAQGDGPVLADLLYRFVDRDGATLALRPDMTIPIARMVATRYQPSDMPLRLYYVGNVFRYAEPQAGRYREFTQVGVELIGAAGPRADAEVVAVAAGVLEHLGLASFRLDLGHVGYFRGLVESVDDGRLSAELKEALLKRDYVRYEAVVKESGLDAARKRALLELPWLRGGGEALDKARALARDCPEALAALENLAAIYELVKAYGLEPRVGIDLGMTKDIDYYSGLLIEGYTPELGFTLASGGRYDSLVGRFGQPFPATGFAFGVERAMLALDRQGRRELGPAAPALFLFCEPGHEAALLRLARALREQGVRVEVDVQGLSREEALAHARRRGIPKAACVRGAAEGEPYIEAASTGAVPGGPDLMGAARASAEAARTGAPTAAPTAASSEAPTEAPTGSEAGLFRRITFEELLREVSPAARRE